MVPVVSPRTAASLGLSFSDWPDKPYLPRGMDRVWSVVELVDGKVASVFGVRLTLAEATRFLQLPHRYRAVAEGSPDIVLRRGLRAIVLEPSAEVVVEGDDKDDVRYAIATPAKGRSSKRAAKAKAAKKSATKKGNGK